MDLWQTSNIEFTDDPEKQWMIIREFCNTLKDYVTEAADGSFKTESAFYRHYAEGLRKLQRDSTIVQTYLDLAGVDSGGLAELTRAISAEFDPGDYYGQPVGANDLMALLRDVWAAADRCCNLLLVKAKTKNGTQRNTDQKIEKKSQKNREWFEFCDDIVKFWIAEGANKTRKSIIELWIAENSGEISAQYPELQFTFNAINARFKDNPGRWEAKIQNAKVQLGAKKRNTKRNTGRNS